MSQADVTKFRAIRLQTAATDVINGPTDGVTPPHMQMSPVATSGMPTTGFIFMLKAPSAAAAVAGAGGFLITIWFRDPNTQRWGSSTSVSVNYNATWICTDVDAMDAVNFQIGNVSGAGGIDVHFAEQ